MNPDSDPQKQHFLFAPFSNSYVVLIYAQQLLILLEQKQNMSQKHALSKQKM